MLDGGDICSIRTDGQFVPDTVHPLRVAIAAQRARRARLYSDREGEWPALIEPCRRLMMSTRHTADGLVHPDLIPSRERKTTCPAT